MPAKTPKTRTWELPDLENLSPAERQLLAEREAYWDAQIQPHLDAIRESERITHKDLAIRIGPCPQKL